MSRRWDPAFIIHDNEYFTGCYCVQIYFSILKAFIFKLAFSYINTNLQPWSMVRLHALVT